MALQAGSIYAELSLDDKSFWASMASTSAKAGQVGKELGTLLGQHFTSSATASTASARNIGHLTGTSFGQGLTHGVNQSIAQIPSLVANKMSEASKVAQKVWTSALGWITKPGAIAPPPVNFGGGGGGAPNMANNLGLGNNFVFAIQDASSAIGQFGATTTGLRFAILGAVNNIQMLVMTAALAGTGFKGLLASITGLHVGLAIFSAAISLLPLLFGKTAKATDEAKNKLDDLNKSLREQLELIRLRAALEPKVAFPVDVNRKILSQQAQDNEAKAKNELAIVEAQIPAALAAAEAARKAVPGGGDIRDPERALAQKRAQEAQDKLNALLVEQHTLQQKATEAVKTRVALERGAAIDAQKKLNEEGLKNFKNEEGQRYEKNRKQKIDELNDAVRGEIDSNQDDLKMKKDQAEALRDFEELTASNKWEKESERIKNSFFEEKEKLDNLGLLDKNRLDKLDKAEKDALNELLRKELKDDRDRVLNAKQLDLEIRKLRMPSFSGAGALTSPEELVNRIQRGANETEERQIDNQLKQIQIAEKQNELTEKVVTNILKMPLFGFLP